MRRIFILTVSLIFANIAMAQNVTMAKAFFKKAQREYENKNYKEALKLIKKTKENLNGKTNPDITYLEAKASYERYINVNTAVTLFKQFLNEAQPDDGRISEVSQILVDIQTSDNFYANGNVKTYARDDWTKYFREDGSLNCEVITVDDGTITRYYLDNVLRVEKYRYTIYNSGYDSGTNLTIYDENGDFFQSYKSKKHATRYAFYTGEFRNAYEFMKSQDFHFSHHYGYIKSIYPIEGITPLEKDENIGIIKEYKQFMNNQLDPGKYYIYTFNKNGIPIKRELYKNFKDKLLKTEVFNKETKKWVKE